MKKNKTNLIIIAFSILSMIFMIHIGSIIGGKLKVDFTEENLFTLSDGSKAILKQLTSPLKATLYYSKTAANKGSEGIKTFNLYSEYINSLLKEYAANSRNNLKLEFVDPRPDTKEEEAAVAAGLKRFNLTESETYIFGLVIENESGNKKIIEFFDPAGQENIEYNITKLIYSINNPRKKTIGVLSSLPVLQEDVSPYMMQMMQMQGRKVERSWIFTQLLKEFFTLKKINTEVESIEAVDALLIIHPKGFSEKTLWAIDQYVMDGGSVLALVDPNAITDTTSPANPMQGPKASSSDLNRISRQWGVELIDNQYAGDKYLTGKGRFSANSAPARILPLLNCNQKCTSVHKDAISSQLSNLMLIYPGAFKKVDFIKDVSITPILTTTDKGNTYTAEGYEFSNPAALWEKFSEGTKPLVLGYKIIGKFKSAYPTGITVDVDNKDKKSNVKTKTLTGLTASTKEAAIIMFSDVDFIHDQFAFKQNMFGTSISNNNSTLVMNALESLAGSKNLMSVRSKGKLNRSFDVIDKIEFEADQRTKNKVTLISGRIQKFQKELNMLGRAANENNIALIQNESIRKKKQLNRAIAKLKSELREAKREGRESIEIIGKRLQYINTLLIPMILVFIGFGIYRRRQKLINKQS
ncbi:MAG: GldG family protein [Bdellovibrionaceae bacterium]|jgi:ABC-2 type transport system permease protein|nr:GldG family protein [Pseudobdellovibrionaceae bacterium]